MKRLSIINHGPGIGSAWRLLLVAGISMLILFTSCSRNNSADETTVTLGYNSFLSDSFTDAPPPIEVINAELARVHPEIALQYQVMPQDMLDSLIIWLSSQDQTVDIYGMDVPWVTQFGRAGWAAPLNQYIPELEQYIYPAGLEIFAYDDDYLAIPFWGGVAGLYYRTDLLAEYGFAPPESVDEMIEIITAIRADQPSLAGLLWPGEREESLNMFFATLLYAFGGSYTTDQGGYAFDSQAGHQAVEFMRTSIAEGWSPRGLTSWNRLESRQRFVAGEAIFSWDNHDIITWLDDPEQSAVAGSWGFMPFPANPGGRSVAVTGGFGFAMNPYSSNPEAATRVLEVIAGPTVQKGFALAWGPVQHAVGLYEDPEVQEYNPNVQLLEPVLAHAINRPPSRNYAELSDIMLQELHSALTGSRAVEDALTNMNRRAAALEAR
ncbi:extracellular solute-binding protein [Spirochaeta africana]|uniref:ABC-type sugar transport system, periplasmic component n=1 Tax=Spirochaeta africana (strain ATCC 700263 / DSM 8902 / Z-7692) TaxID=889378 RepID=H9UM02_SPIAZ|nr:extracellular solute-binding protein [Spirochaeta africana]AFG38545.1 ABC-type sugar transport system, periplasmic component [Spirochaeta africana DSM 8902]